VTPEIAVRELLFPTDLGPESDRAFDHARSLAARFGARLTLYHAVEVPDHRFAHWAFAHGHEVWCHAELEARRDLERRAEGIEPAPRVVVERTSSTHRALVAFIRSQAPDLVVMATHGREGIAHVLLGSVTERVVRQVYRPVLCLREPEHGGAHDYRRILVPTDFSVPSRLAFPMAAHVARSFGAEVIAVHVVPEASLATLSGVPENQGRIVPSEAYLHDFVAPDFEGVRLTAQVLNGPVWSRITALARVEKADLVVMSTRGHDSLADKVLGSNTDRVLRHAPCPVLAA
jgi:nucleotide-binding universal stress UspA family protein